MPDLNHDVVEELEAEIERLQKAYRPADMLEYQRVVEENAKLQAVVDAALKQDNPCDELIEALAALEDDDE